MICVIVSVGSNPKVTNSELLRTLEVELRTLPNPSSPTKIELRTHPNPTKIPNSEPTNPTTINILEKTSNFELLRTLEVKLRTFPNTSSPTKTKLRTQPNPPKIPNSKPTNWVRPNTSLNIWKLPASVLSANWWLLMTWVQFFYDQNFCFFLCMKTESMQLLKNDSLESFTLGIYIWLYNKGFCCCF